MTIASSKKKGQLDEEVFISVEVFGKIVDLMECIHNLDGNYDESEVLQVADALRDFSSSDLDHINSLDHIDMLEI